MLTMLVVLTIVFAVLALLFLWLLVNEKHTSARLERSRLRACEKADKAREEKQEALSAQQEAHGQALMEAHNHCEDLATQLAAANSWLELFLTAEETDEEGTIKINRHRASELFRRTKS